MNPTSQPEPLPALAQALVDGQVNARAAGAVLILAEIDRLTAARLPDGAPLLRHEVVLDAMWLAMLALGGRAASHTVQQLSVPCSRE